MCRQVMTQAALAGRAGRFFASAALFVAAALAALPAAAATDADGDGYSQPTDCDDSDPAVWSLPGEASNLRFTSSVTFLWDTAADLGGTAASAHYDTLRSTIASEFSTSPPASCIDPDGLTASTTDTGVPSPGQVFFYLVRLRNACGVGPLGTTSSGTPIPGVACDCTALCDDANACTTDRCSDGACVHDPVRTAILEAPQGTAVCPGETALFTVRGVPDGSTLHYQWKKNGFNVGTDSATTSSIVCLQGIALPIAVRNARSRPGIAASLPISSAVSFAIPASATKSATVRGEIAP